MCLRNRWFSQAQIRSSVGVMLVFGCVALSGCAQGAKTPQGEQATISGSVTNDGKPVTPDSNIVFYCDESSATAAGKIDASGKFSVTAADKAVGIPTGKYKVMVRPPEAPVAQASDSEKYKEMMMKGGSAEKPKPAESDIPVKFQAFDTSSLVLEVKAGSNNFDIDLAK